MIYAPLGKARFMIEQTLEGEVLTIPPVRQVLYMLFLPVWLAGWTAGGMNALAVVFVHHQPFLMFWLVGWALGWVFATSTLGWMFTGKQVLKFSGNDLEVGLQIFGLYRAKLYHGQEIKEVTLAPTGLDWSRRGPQLPFGVFGGSGAVQFTYGQRSCYVAPGLDPEEAGRIVDWLKKRLADAQFKQKETTA